MLQADKQVLLAGVKRNALELRQRELEFHVERYTNLATQASVIAGFSFESLVELEVPEHTHPLLSSCYFIFGSAAMALSLYVLCTASFACVFGHRLALQGPHGSLEKAVHILIDHRMHIFSTAGIALLCLVCAAVLMAWIKMGYAASVVSAIFFAFAVAVYQRMSHMFDVFHIPEDKLVTGAARVGDPSSSGMALVDLARLNPISTQAAKVPPHGTGSSAGYERLGDAEAASADRSGSSGVGLAASVTPKQQGHLFKAEKGYFGAASFVRRYFVLVGHQLYQFRSWENFGADGLRAASNFSTPIDVRRYDAVRLRDTPDDAPNRLDLVPSMDPLDKKYEFQAVTPQDMEDWLVALRAAKGTPEAGGAGRHPGDASVLM